MKEQILQDVTKWISSNGSVLPLNSGYWKVFVFEMGCSPTAPVLTFGKYSATMTSSETFYKPISRMINIKEDE